MSCSGNNCDKNNNQGGGQPQAKVEQVIEEKKAKSFMERLKSLMKVNKNREVKKNRN